MNSLPYLETKEQAIELLDSLKNKCEEDVAVFTDGGWDIGPIKDRAILVVIDGNGQEPFAKMSYDVFKQLRNENLLFENILKTHKKRSYHIYWRKGAKT